MLGLGAGRGRGSLERYLERRVTYSLVYCSVFIIASVLRLYTSRFYAAIEEGCLGESIERYGGES